MDSRIISPRLCFLGPRKSRHKKARLIARAVSLPCEIQKIKFLRSGRDSNPCTLFCRQIASHSRTGSFAHFTSFSFKKQSPRTELSCSPRLKLRSCWRGVARAFVRGKPTNTFYHEVTSFAYFLDFAATFTFFGLASAALGIVTITTPSSTSALALSPDRLRVLALFCSEC